MQPRIQYARTTDGASLAYWVIGDGPTLIQLPSIPFTHIQKEWEDPDWRAWYERIAAKFRLVRYDARGCGLSSSSDPVYSLDAMLEDLRAVVDKTGSEDPSLIAPVQAGPVGVAFAARNPSLVRRLILWCAVSRGDELMTSSFAALRTVSLSDWDLFAETAAHAVVAGWDQAHTAHRMASIMRESCNAEIHEAVLEGFLSEDISADLARVACPVMVGYRKAGTSPLPASARYLAAAIRNASLLSFPGASLLMVTSDTEEIAGAFSEFLLAGEAAPKASRPSGFQTLLYTDIEGHTGMIQRLGDERGRGVLREHERLTRGVIEHYRGTEVLTRGDGFLVSFETAHGALECAAELQRRLADAAADSPVELRVRIGINAGEPIAEGGELHGAAVKAAEAIAGQAEGGQVLVANVVRELAHGKSFAFSSHGDSTLPGLEEPVRLWELHWAHAAS